MIKIDQVKKGLDLLKLMEPSEKATLFNNEKRSNPLLYEIFAFDHQERAYQFRPDGRWTCEEFIQKFYEDWPTFIEIADKGN